MTPENKHVVSKMFKGVVKPVDKLGDLMIKAMGTAPKNVLDERSVDEKIQVSKGSSFLRTTDKFADKILRTVDRIPYRKTENVREEIKSQEQLPVESAEKAETVPSQKKTSFIEKFKGLFRERSNVEKQVDLKEPKRETVVETSGKIDKKERKAIRYIEKKGYHVEKNEGDPFLPEIILRNIKTKEALRGRNFPHPTKVFGNVNGARDYLRREGLREIGEVVGFVAAISGSVAIPAVSITMAVISANPLWLSGLGITAVEAGYWWMRRRKTA